MSNLFQLGEFTLNSGRRSSWKLECDTLTDGDWECLAYLMSEAFGPFRSVEGVPTGGLKLAAALDKYKFLEGSSRPFTFGEGPHWVVDDVLTTGSSLLKVMETHQQASKSLGKDIYVLGVVVFARGLLPMRVNALFPMPHSLWGK